MATHIRGGPPERTGQAKSLVRPGGPSAKTFPRAGSPNHQDDSKETPMVSPWRPKLYQTQEAREAGGGQHLDALREDVHKAVMEAGQRCGTVCDGVAGYLWECGWRHPEIGTEGQPGPLSIGGVR